jgi:hypothetical protein
MTLRFSRARKTRKRSMRLYLRFASWRWIPPAGAGGGYRLPTPTQPVCQMAETSSCAALHFLTPLFHCQRSCVSVGRDQQLCILFAQLCCLSAGRDKATISNKKCDRPRGEGAERRQPTVCILGAEAKALSADNECMLSAQLSVRWMRPAKLSILFAQLCCLSAG